MPVEKGWGGLIGKKVIILSDLLKSFKIQTMTYLI